MEIESQIKKFLSRAYIVHMNAKKIIRRRWIGWKRSCQTCTTTVFHSSMRKLVTLSPSISSLLIFSWRHGGHVGSPKQRNGRHVGIPDLFSGYRVLFICKFLFLFWLQNLAADRVSENQQYKTRIVGSDKEGRQRRR